MPVQIAVDKDRILFGAQQDGRMAAEVGVYVPHQNKFYFSDQLSSNPENSMVCFEGYKKNFFSEIWCEYLASLPAEFESFEVNPFIFDIFSFNETLFFYVYGLFRFKSLQTFRDNFRILRPDFYWEQPREAEQYFERLQHAADHVSTDPRDRVSSQASLEAISLNHSSTIGSQVFRMPSGLEESEDDEAFLAGQRRASENQLDTEDLSRRFSQEEAEYKRAKEQREEEETGRDAQAPRRLLKEKFSSIEEESQFQEVSKDYSGKERISGGVGWSGRKESRGETGEEDSAYFRQNLMNNEYFSKKNHFDNIDSNFDSTEKEVTRFIEKYNLRDQRVESPFLSSNQPPPALLPPRHAPVTRSLNMQKKAPEPAKVYLEIDRDRTFDSNEVMQDDERFLDLEPALRGAPNESMGAWPGEKYSVSSGVGFNKYILSSEVVAQDNAGITEFETGRMSQKSPSERLSLYKVSQSSHYFYGDTVAKSESAL